MFIKIRFWLISLFLLLPGILLAQEAVLCIFLNTENRGDYFLILEDRDVCIQKDDLLSLGFSKEEIDRYPIKDGAISLKSLYPELLYRIDEKNACLYLTADLGLFETHSIDLSSPKISYPTYPRENSFFSNYRLNYSFSEDKSYHCLVGSNELFLKMSDYLVSSDFSWDNKNIKRGNTSIVRDFEREMTRVSCGDLYASSGRLGGGKQILGCQIKRDFAIQPGFVSYPLPSFFFALSKPSEINAYLGKRLMAKESFQPGEVELLNLPVQGQELLKLVIMDNKGVTKELYSKLYQASFLLKPGLKDYSLSLGSKRQGEEYKGLAGIFSYRMGLTGNITGKVRVEADEKTANSGIEFTHLLPYGDTMRWGVARSTSEGLSGAGCFYDYQVAFGRVSFGANLEVYTQNYSNLSVGASDDKAKVDRRVNLGLSLGRFGRLSTNSFTQKRYIKKEKRGFSVNYSKSVSSGCLNISANRTDEGRVTDNVMVYFFFSPGKNTQAGYRVNTSNGKQVEEFSLKSTPKLGPGFSASVEKRSDGEVEERLLLKYQGPYGNYSARCSSSENTNYELTTDGSVVFIGGIRPYPCRTINDSFALVKVDGLKGAKIYRGGSIAGRTNNRGECLISGLSSYSPNQLSLDLTGKELPIEYNVSEPTKYVSTPYRGGVKIDFGAARVQGIGGRIVIKGDGEKPVELTTLIIYTSKEVNVPIGKNGEFYLENIPSGRYQAKTRYKERDYTSTIEIPESEEMFIDVGNVYATQTE
ncbi:MAG: fimbria/pilus outer membrane usher protein [bacterium]